jgi:cellulose synthase operon protein C
MLKVECESCKAPYQVDERRVPPTGLKMRCPKCGHTFLVADPSKGAAAPATAPAGGARSLSKATMMGFAQAPQGKKAPPTGNVDDALDRPPAKAAPPRGPAAVKPPPAAVKPPPAVAKPPPAAAQPPPAPAAFSGLDDLDLPALSGELDLPSAVQRPPARQAPSPSPSARRPPSAPSELDFDMDLPAVASMDLPSVAARPPKGGRGGGDLPATRGRGDIDLPSPARGDEFGDIDLPSPARGDGFGDIDLPSPARGDGFGDIDLPSPARGDEFGDIGLPSRARGGFGNIDLPASKHAEHLPSPRGGQSGQGGRGGDLPMLPDDLPLVGAGLPVPSHGAGLPVPSRGVGLPVAAEGGLPVPKAGFGEIDLPTLQNELPEAMSAQAHMPAPVSDDRLLPERFAPHHAAPHHPPPHHPPPQVAFGELDLPLADGPSPLTDSRPAPDGVSFGELDLPADPSVSAGAGAGAPLSLPGDGGAMAFGEVDLGGDGGGAQVMGPPPAASAGNVAFQEAPLGPPGASMGPLPTQARAPAPERRASRVPFVLAGVAAVLVLGGAALEMTPLGAYGRYSISDTLRAGDYAASAAAAGDAARKKLATDTFPAAQAATEEMGELVRKSPRSRPLAAYAAFLEYANQVRFGADPARTARAQTYLAEMPQETEVPYLAAALAARDAAAGDWAAAKAGAEASAKKPPADGIREDLAALRGEIELARRDPEAALAAFAELGPTARGRFGIARAYHLAGNLAKANEEVAQTLAASPDHAGARTLRARLTWELQRDHTAALKDLSQVLAAEARPSLGVREVSDALAARGTILLAQDRAGEARAAFDEAVKIDPRNAAALVGQGEVLYADGRYTEALTRFDEAMQKDPGSLSATIGGAKTMIALERLGDAKTQLTTARERAPKHMGVALWLAKTEEALGNKKDAEALYGSAVDLADADNPDAIHAFAGFASFLAAQGRTVEAEAKLDQARSKLPDSAALQRSFGEVAAAQGHFDDAIAHFESALEKNPTDIGTQFRLGVTYRKMGKLDVAGEAFDKVSAGEPEYPGLALERGLLFEESGDVQKALEQFQGAFQKAPDDIDLALRVGAAFVAIGKLEEALPLLTKVKDERPNSAEANHYIGRAYLKQGGLEAAAAMRYLQRAVELDPNRAEYHLYVAWAANEANPAQLGLARTHVDKALALDNHLADAYWQRGVVERREGAVNDAIRDLKRALELKPSRHEAYATLAECYEDKNDRAAALAAWTKALAGDDKQPYWRWRYGRLLAERGQAGEAAGHLAFAVEGGKSAQPRPGWLGPAAFEAGEALRKSGQKKEACESYHLYLELSPPTAPDRRDALRATTDLGCPPDRR